MTTSTPQDPLVLYGQQFASRLLLGTSRYPSPAVLEAAVLRAKPAMVTASLRRQGSNPAESGSSFWELLRKLNVPVLPNTAGCHSAQEAITTAQMAREVFNTPWIKLELIGDDYTLQPDTLNLVGVAEHLIKEGFQVLPYCTEDLVLCQRLVDVGCQAVMPWAAPIGTGRGPVNPYALQTLRERLNVPMLVDAGWSSAAVGQLDVVASLAGLAAEIPFVLFSTDLVFDGRQGNYVDQEMVAKLKKGMTREQVEFLPRIQVTQL